MCPTSFYATEQDVKLLAQTSIISGTNQVAAIDLVSGDIVHSYPFDGDGWAVGVTEQFMIAVVNEDIEFDNYTGKGTLVCFEHGGNQPHWAIPLGGSCLGQIACDDQRCYLGARDGRFSAVNLSDGSIAWNMNCADLFVGRKSVWAERVWADKSVLLNGPDVIFTTSHNYMNAPSAIVAVDSSTGAKRWSLTNAVVMGGEMAASGDSLFAVSDDRKLVRINIGSGTLRHVSLLPEVPGGEFAGVRIDSGHAYIVGGDKQVWRFRIDAL